MLKSLAIAQGYQYEAFGKGGLFGEIETSADDASDAVNNLKTSLLGFDKLNILGTSSSTIGKDYTLLTEQIKSYASNLDNISNNANKQAEKLLEWLGYHKQINIEVDEEGNKIETIVWELGDGYTKLEQIKDMFSLIGITIATIGITNFITNISNSFTGLKTLFSNLSSSFFTTKTGLGDVEKAISSIDLSANNTNATLLTTTGKITAVVAAVLLIATAFADVYQENEKFRLKVDETLNGIKENIDKIWTNSLKPIWDNLSPILEEIWRWFSETIAWAVEGVLEILETITDLLTGDFSGAVENIKEGFKSWGEALKNFFSFGKGFEDNLLYPTPSKEEQEFWDWFGGGNLQEQWNYVYDKIKNFFGIDKAVDKRMENITNNQSMIGNDPMTGLLPSIIGSIATLSRSITNGDREIVEAINNSSNRSITLNGRKVSEEIYDDLEEEGRRRGKMIFA